jgi:hypothetical protein
MRQGKVFGIGLSRTGTKSLAAALSMLGIRACWFPHDRRTHRQLRSGDFRLRILNEYDALTDTPAAAYYPQFDKLYPGSRFVLTVRDRDEWLASCRQNWGRRGRRLISVVSPQWRKFGAFIDTAVYGCELYDEERFGYVFDTHIYNVRHYFAQRSWDLLVMDLPAGDGWEKLCSFLDVAMPHTPFPSVNRFDVPGLR